MIASLRFGTSIFEMWTLTGVKGEKGTPGFSRVQFRLTLAMPLVVVRLRMASPPEAQIIMNSLTEAAKNWEFYLSDIFTAE